MEIDCERCGNAIDAAAVKCPFCGLSVEPVRSCLPVFSHRIVSLEQGRPFVALALDRMKLALADCKKNHVPLLTLIHGYGSSGKGGAIRVECRKTLDDLKARGEIADYIVGEKFSRRSPSVKAILRRYPELGSDKNLNRNNKGITLVVL
ncbi:MAG: hypothetical protein CSB23_00940 [Deltaproteobacteria bacterium]|nr:MAG: hypothetical protein CSB23_00940 [Deltaproteobacteria bacterium]